MTASPDTLRLLEWPHGEERPPLPDLPTRKFSSLPPHDRRDRPGAPASPLGTGRLGPGRLPLRTGRIRDSGKCLVAGGSGFWGFSEMEGDDEGYNDLLGVYESEEGYAR